MSDAPDPAIALRPATAADRPFLLALYASTREQELAQVPFTPDQKAAFLEQQFSAQNSHYAGHYRDASFDVVSVAGERAGRLIVARQPDGILIVDVALLPAFRGRGVGTRLLVPLLAEADACCATVTLHVERFNPAQRLYQRLGFALDGVAAENDLYLRFVRPPASDGSPQAKTAS